MSQSRINKTSSSSSEKKSRERSREKINDNKLIKNNVNIIRRNIENIRNNKTYISLEESIQKYDSDNLSFLEKNSENQEYKKIIEYIGKTSNITPSEKQEYFSQLIIDAINTLEKSDVKVDLPQMPYGQHLSDKEFVELFKECVSYANFHLDCEKLKEIKKKLIADNFNIVKKIFEQGQILKDLLQNAIISILTAESKQEQEDNFNILKTKNLTLTPFIKLDFNDNKLDKAEFIDTFCSNVYIKHYKKVLKKFIPDFRKYVSSEDKLKEYIKKYFENHYIYFCELPQNILALTIHTGNMYLKASYLREFYNEIGKSPKIIIRQKIVLNVGHELTHTLLREINPKMANNFLIKSNNKDNENKKDNCIIFKDKFVSNFHYLDSNESGNIFDHLFFNEYYFDELLEDEAFFFLKIKNIKTIKEYKNDLENVINNEKSKKDKSFSEPVNKFKKIEKEPARCIRSKIIKVVKVSEAEYNRKIIDSDDEESDEEL